jgi:hypothetical protein
MKFSRQTSMIAAGLLAGVSAAAVFQVLANAEATRRVEAALARVPGLHVKSVAVDAWTGRVALAGLSAESKGLHLTASRAIVNASSHSLGAFISPAAAADDTATVDDVEIDLGVAKIHVPHIEATGTSLSSDDLKALVDPNDPTSATDRLAKLTATSIAASDLSIDVAAGQITEKIAYKDIKLDQVNEGKIGNLAIGGATLSVSSPAMPAPLEGTIGTFSATNVDLGLYARIVTQARTDANEPLATLYDSATIDGVKLKVGDGVDISVGKMSAGGIKARPFLQSVLDFQKLMPTKPDEKPTPEQTKAILSFVSDIYSSIAIGSTEVDDIAVSVDKDGKKGSFGVSKIALNDMSDGHFGEIALDGFNIQAPDVHVKLGTFAIRGFNFKSALVGLQQISPDDPNPVKNLNPRTLIPTVDQVVVADVDADVPDGRNQGNSPDGSRDAFKIGKIEYDGASYLLGIPTVASFIVEHVVADLPANDPQMKQFIALGYPSVDISSKLALAWNEASGELALKELSLTGANMATFKLTGVFGNVTKDLFTGDLAVAQAALFAAVIKAADVRLDNQGLIDKAFTLLAQTSGKSLEQFKAENVAAASVGIPQILGDSPASKAIANAIAKFIAEPKSIEISAESSEGLGAGDLQLLSNPAALVAKLNIKATANE